MTTDNNSRSLCIPTHGKEMYSSPLVEDGIRLQGCATISRPSTASEFGTIDVHADIAIQVL